MSIVECVFYLSSLLKKEDPSLTAKQLADGAKGLWLTMTEEEKTFIKVISRRKWCFDDKRTENSVELPATKVYHIQGEKPTATQPILIRNQDYRPNHYLRKGRNPREKTVVKSYPLVPKHATIAKLRYETANLLQKESTHLPLEDKYISKYVSRNRIVETNRNIDERINNLSKIACINRKIYLDYVNSVGIVHTNSATSASSGKTMNKSNSADNGNGNGNDADSSDSEI